MLSANIIWKTLVLTQCVVVANFLSVIQYYILWNLGGGGAFLLLGAYMYLHTKELLQKATNECERVEKIHTLAHKSMHLSLWMVICVYIPNRLLSLKVWQSITSFAKKYLFNWKVFFLCLALFLFSKYFSASYRK